MKDPTVERDEILRTTIIRLKVTDQEMNSMIRAEDMHREIQSRLCIAIVNMLMEKIAPKIKEALAVDEEKIEEKEKCFSCFDCKKIESVDNRFKSIVNNENDGKICVQLCSSCFSKRMDEEHEALADGEKI